jgi:hypothetical protein
MNLQFVPGKKKKSAHSLEHTWLRCKLGTFRSRYAGGVSDYFHLPERQGKEWERHSAMGDETSPPKDCDGLQMEGSDLRVLINEERALFNANDGSDDEDDYDLRVARIRELRRNIADFPVRGLDDVLTKALFVLRIYAESNETLDDVIVANDHSDLSFGIVVARDLVSCPESRPLLKKLWPEAPRPILQIPTIKH